MVRASKSIHFHKKNSMTFLLFVAITLFIFVVNADESSPVTCGSGIKLVHKETKFHLHSHAIAWGSGSSQQSVTATSTQSDPNSIWVVKEPIRTSQTCELSKPILCGSMISLEHAGTGIYLLSRSFEYFLNN